MPQIQKTHIDFTASQVMKWHSSKTRVSGFQSEPQSFPEKLTA